MGPRRAARLARAAQLHVKLAERAAQNVALLDAARRKSRDGLDALPPETPEDFHVAEIQRAQRQGAFARLPYYRFRCTCQRSVADFGPWTRNQAEAQRQLTEHLTEVGAVPVEVEAV